MKTKKILVILITILLVSTAILAVLHLTSRQQVPEGTLAVNYQGKTVYADIDSLAKQAISGTIVNGKGEEKQVDAVGIELSALLESLGIAPDSISAVIVTADDAFSASVTAEEIETSGKVFLSQEEDGVTLLVFGDDNAKRNVRNVVKLDVV